MPYFHDHPGIQLDPEILARDFISAHREAEKVAMSDTLKNEIEVKVPAITRYLKEGDETPWGKLTRDAMIGDTVVYVEKSGDRPS